MSSDQRALAALIAKEEIRELVLLYSRGVDRKDAALLRTLYTEDATDTHGDTFDGNAEDYIRFLERAFPHMEYSGHHVCNHLISVDGDTGEGEVYALAYHMIPNGQGAWVEDFMCVRYIDRYRRQAGRWYFSQRAVTYDLRRRDALPLDGKSHPRGADPSASLLKSPLFARGPRVN